jgi:formate--tetrahydrofolate ligase
MTTPRSSPISALKSIADVARKLGLGEGDFEMFGRSKAKIEPDRLWEASPGEQTSKLILVTGISPTPAGEGKTTTSIGLADGLNRVGKRAALCLREPSMGPCFGRKGGATGAGLAQIVPADDINLHFTGDIHAVGAANNLLAALVDNHLYWGNALDIDPDRVVWRRALDITDRALRDLLLAPGAETTPVHRGFDITAASEVMAILCLAQSPEDLERRFSNIIVAYDRSGMPVTARDLGAHSAMTALLKDAIRPNLVQTLEGNPTLIHGGPFANIAHGCSSVIATRLGLATADYVITEAGFGADLGAEKFFNIKCRQSGLRPDVAVIVATVRALKFHGGVPSDSLTSPDEKAVQRGMQNLLQHVWKIGKFGVPVVVAINHFATDQREEVETIRRACETFGVPAVVSRHWGDGGRGAEDLAETVIETLDRSPTKFRVLYPDEATLLEKIETIAREIHGATQVRLTDAAALQLENAEAFGYGRLPICLAKSQYADPSGRDLPCLDIREIRLAAGAEYLVAICGQMNTMPGLPRRPAALDIHLNDEGQVVGPGW